MQEDSNPLNPLYQSIENYGKTSFTLLKLKALEKAAHLISNYVAKATVVVAFTCMIVFLSFALSIWLGEIFGGLYFGFSIVAGMYGLIGIIVHFFAKRTIQKQVMNSIVSQILDSTS